jgi:hypothetical protein
LTAEDRRARARAVTEAATRLAKVENTLLEMQQKTPALVREVKAIREEITAATTMPGDEE